MRSAQAVLSTEVPIRRVVRRSNEWTLREHEVVVSHWPDVSTIRRRLPHRTRTAIVGFAGKCNLRKQIHVWTGEQDAKLRRMVRAQMSRKDIARELGLTLMQVANRMGYASIRYDRRAPKPSGHALYDSIARRAFDTNTSLKELDEACRSGAVFQKFGRGRKISIRAIARAVQALGGELCIEWSALE